MKAHTYVRQNKYKNDHAIIMATRKKKHDRYSKKYAVRVDSRINMQLNEE